MEEDLEALRARLVALTKENQTLRWKNEQLARENEALKGSASWRVTAPLRSVGSLVNRATEKLRAVPPRRPAEERKKGDPELTPWPEELPSWPALTVVSAVYNKAKELPFFLEGFARQRYPGALEVIVVDDASTDATREVLEAAQKKHAWLRVEHTAQNAGQCRARNRGVALAKGSIIFFMDGDCVPNESYLRTHAMKHVLQDELDIVLGPYNLETQGEDPFDVIARDEREPERLLLEERQDPRRPESFLNCVTRNLSIKRRFLEANGFTEIYDERFSYSASGTGYGWEDVEAGYRFYLAGARIGFEPRAFVVHVTHPPAVGAGHQRLGLVENWRKLLEKHPDLPLVAREWTSRTHANMVTWLASSGLDATAQLDACLPLVAEAARVAAPAVRPARRRLRILTYRWHCGHQYELWKLPHDFTLACGLTRLCDRWDYRSRPLPASAHFEDLDALDLASFDACILHFDENSLAPEKSNGVLAPDWGALFQHLRKNVAAPLVAVCHGTPQFKGQYDHRLERPDLAIETDEPERRRLVEFLGDTLVVCNSHQAAAEWGFKRSRVIWHGFDPAEYPPARRAKKILTVAESIKTRPHYRGFYLYEKVTRDVPCDILSGDMPNAVRVIEPSRAARTLSEYGGRWFRNYVDLVRDYAIFFNPTLRSPMPRARGEAMLCGLATVSAENHDVARFVEQGVDGFYATEPGELNEQLKFLARDERVARAMGEAGRKKAMSVFHIDRYLAEWQALLDELVPS
jgi:GT2 family glycosyltransferase/glycosyltransferase involved in cell wall biosynthesis